MQTMSQVLTAMEERCAALSPSGLFLGTIYLSVSLSVCCPSLPLDRALERVLWMAQLPALCPLESGWGEQSPSLRPSPSHPASPSGIFKTTRATGVGGPAGVQAENRRLVGTRG